MSWTCECSKVNDDPWGCPACGRPAPDAQVAIVGMERAADRTAVRIRQRALTVAIAVLLIVGLVGLIVERPPTLSRLAVGAGATVVPAAAARTAGSSFQLEMSLRTEGLKIGSITGDLTTTATGAFDPVARRGFLTAHQAGSTVSKALAATEQQVVISADAVYTTAPAAVGGKHWLKLPMPAGANGVLGGMGNDPSQALAELQRSASDIHSVGTDTIRGVRTAHYKLTLTSPQPSPVRFAVPAEAWVDTNGRLRRLRMNADLKQLVPAGSPANVADELSAARLRLSIDYFGFGVAVPDRTPPADDVADRSVGFQSSTSVSGAVGGAVTTTRSPECQQALSKLQTADKQPAGQAPNNSAMSDALKAIAAACGHS